VGTVREARDRYLAENGFSVESYTETSFELPIFRWKARFPNPPTRRKVIPLHDLHHVATGFGTDYIGEAEIGAYELVAGCNTFIATWLNGMAAAFGLLIAPVRTVRAGLRARGTRTLYFARLPYDRALSMSVEDLRAHLGIPREGLADRPRKLHRRAPAQGTTPSAVPGGANATSAS
jgi:hypothetical protein